MRLRLASLFCIFLFAGCKTHNAELKRLAKAIQSFPGSAKAQFDFAEYLADSCKKYNQAKKHYEEAIRINPDYFQAHNNLGILLTEHLRKHALAKKQYEEAIRIEPENAHAITNLALLLTDYTNERHKEAAHYRKEKRMNPDRDYPKPYYSKDQHRAALLYKKAIAIQPDDAYTYYNWAILSHNDYFRQYDFAKHLYQETIRLDSNYSEAYWNLGVLLYDELNQPDSACIYYKAALRFKPKLRYKALEKECLQNK